MKKLWLVLVVGVLSTATAAPDTGNAGRESLARRLVTTTASIREGELVQLSGCPADVELLEDLAVAVRRLGAHPLITLSSERLARRLFDEVPDRFDAQPAAFEQKLAGIIDARIQTEFADDDALSRIPAQRIETVGRGNRDVYALLRKRKVRLVWLGNGLYPSEARARRAGLPLAELQRLFREGINVDPLSLRATGDRLKRLFAAGKVVRLTTPRGTDISMDVAGQPLSISAGILDAKQRESGAPPWTWLPAGEIYLVPVPGSANGRIVLDRYPYEGKLIGHLTVIVKDGKISQMAARSGGEGLAAAYTAAEDGKELLSSLDIGINPKIRLPATSLLQSNVPAGTVTLGFGNNTWAGGDVKIPFTLPLFINDGTLAIDGTTIIDKGVLKP
jgi:leucyl aminopeptidase (aminopeptidase T)